MAVLPSKHRALARASVAVADGAWLFLAAGLIALIVMTAAFADEEATTATVRGRMSLVEKACDEIYVVGEGETLHTISDKCSDPYIVERNPHIHDPDDVFPGLVIRIVPLN